MVQLLDYFMICTKNRMRKAAETLREESGVSSFVATILLIVIVVALCAAFWTNINKWFDDTWDIITGKAGGVGV